MKILNLLLLTLCFAWSHSVHAQEEAETAPAPPETNEPSAAESSAPGTEEETAADAEIEESTETEASSPREPEMSLRSLVDLMTPTDIQDAIESIRENYIHADELTKEELNRAAMEGLLVRLGYGAALRENPEARPEIGKNYRPLFEILRGDVAYLRLGAMNAEGMEKLDLALAEIQQKALSSFILDLRGTAASSDYEIARQIADRFTPAGRPLFIVKRKTGEDQLFTSKEEPRFTGFLVVVTDDETGGAAEVLAGILRQETRAMIVGAERTTGSAVEYQQAQLSGGRTLFIATGEVVLAPDRPIFPDGVAADLPVAGYQAEDQDALFTLMDENGVESLVFEKERAHRSEKALILGEDPLIKMIQNLQETGGPEIKARDAVLQRAVDLLTVIDVVQSGP